MTRQSKTSRERIINSIDDYTRFLTDENIDDLVLFRGQREDKPLLPKIARIKPDRPLLETEQELLKQFREESILYLPLVPNSEWEWLAVAQHHGLPTRLLDWTSNPLAALWFAVGRPSNGTKNGVVWAFTPRKADHVASSTENPFTGTRTKVFRPAHVTERIRVQSGYFTVHKHTENGFIKLDTNRLYKTRLTKLSIPASQFAELRYSLDQFGVNQSTLFPDLDGLCRHIEWQHSFLKDEASLRRNVKERQWEIAR